MTYEKILKELTAFDGRQIFDDYYDLNMSESVEKIRKICMDEIRAKENKKRNSSKVETLAKKITECGIQYQGKHSLMQYGKTEGDYQYFIDGHRILRLEKHIDFPECPKDEKFFDCKKMYDDMPYHETKFEWNAKDILTSYKIAKAESSKDDILIYSFGRYGNGESSYLYYVSAEYLIDFMKVDGCETYSRNTEQKNNPIYLKNSRNDVYLVLPICDNTDGYKAENVGIHNLTTGKYYG